MHTLGEVPGAHLLPTRKRNKTLIVEAREWKRGFTLFTKSALNVAFPPLPNWMCDGRQSSWPSICEQLLQCVCVLKSSFQAAYDANAGVPAVIRARASGSSPARQTQPAEGEIC